MIRDERSLPATQSRTKSLSDLLNPAPPVVPVPSLQCMPKSFSNLLNPAPVVDSLPSIEHAPESLSNLLNPVPISDPVQSIETAPSSCVEPMDIDSNPPDETEERIEPSQALGATQSSLSLSAHTTAVAGLSVQPKQMNIEGKRGDGGQIRKRTTSDDPNPLPRKAAKPVRDNDDFKDLYETVSFQRGYRPIVKSTLRSRIQNRLFLLGQFVPNDKSEFDFRKKILALDPHAIILNPKTIRHFKCAKELRMKEPYNVGNFKSHVEICKGTPKSHKNPAGGMKPIMSFFKKVDKSSEPSNKVSPISLPCPGLCETSYPKIEAYLDRTGAHGGGGPDVSVVARELFGKKYRMLSKARKEQVKAAQSHEWLWRNDHTNGVVYSTNCTKKAGSSESAVSPCIECDSLLSKKLFKNVLQKPRPTDENYKYLNTEYRNDRLSSLFGRCVGLCEIMEVRSTYNFKGSDLIIVNRIKRIVPSFNIVKG